MKKTIICAVMAILMACYCHAAIYIVGNDPFGDWNPAGGVEMTDNGDGIYTYSAVVNGSIWFVFADGLSSDWTTFNNDFRYGPSNGDQTVTVGTWVTTQKAGDHGAYLFTGSGETYTFTFNNNNKQFQIEGYVEPVDDVTYTVAGTQSVFGSDWDATDAANDMTNNGGVYVWKKQNVTLQAPGFEFKVVGNHDWGYFEWPEGFGNNYFVSVPHDGTYTVTITFDPNAADGPALAYNIEENVAPGTSGDMNGDGEITIADVNLLIDAILSSSVDNKYDFNHDGEINVADVMSLIDLLLMDSSVKHLSGEIRFDVDEGTVFIYYTGNENVTLTVHVDGVETPLQDGCIHLSEYGVHFIEVLAKARGYNNLTASFTYNWQNTDPEPIVTPAPEIFFDEEDDYVVVTAYGEGEVFLYINGEQVSNPCELERTNDEYEVYVTAYAQKEGKLMSEEVAMYYIVMPRVIGPVEEMTSSPVINASQGYSSEFGGFYYTVTIEETEPSDIYYRIGVMEDGEYIYGDWMEYSDAIVINEYGTFMVEAFAEAPGKLQSDYVVIGISLYPPTGKD